MLWRAIKLLTAPKLHTYYIQVHTMPQYYFLNGRPSFQKSSSSDANFSRVTLSKRR